MGSAAPDAPPDVPGFDPFGGADATADLADLGDDDGTGEGESDSDLLARLLQLTTTADTESDPPLTRGRVLGAQLSAASLRELRMSFAQRARKAGIPIKGVDDGARCSVALDVDEWPINGLRHPPDRASSGWYFWCGQRDVPDGGEREDAFTSVLQRDMHKHLVDALPYLGLPPGYRVVIAPGYEDVWFDEELLDT